MRLDFKRKLALTSASVLGMALVAACSDSATTGLDRIFGDDPSTVQIVNDNDTITGQCTLAGYTLKKANGKTADRDFNGDGYVCVATTGGKKH